MKIRRRIVPILWNVLVTATVSFAAIIIPLDLLFSLESIEIYLLSVWFTSAVFVLDIIFSILRLKSADEDPIFEEGNGLSIYLKFVLPFDVIAAIPFVILIPFPWLNLFRLFKLVKIIYLMRYWRIREIRFASTLSIIFFIYWAFLATHWVSCAWLSMRGIDLNLDDVSNYLKSMYWTITTITTVGYGDITPQTNMQTIFTICVEILGIGIYSYLIGNIAGLLTKKDPAKAKYLENMERLQALVSMRKIPRSLQSKLRDYYRYVWKKRLGYNEDSFLQGLPPGLKTEVSLNLKKEVIEMIELFKEADEEFIKEIALHLKPIVLLPGDYIFKAGDEGREMYFLVKGDLAVLTKDEESMIATLHSGDFFGEIALLKDKPRTATIKAITYCDLYTLEKIHFTRVVEKFPKIAEKIEHKIRIRIGNLN